MNYYPFHIGDYAAHTRHLTPMEDLAYRRLLDAYYLREGPLPKDVGAVARLIGLREYVEEVKAMLGEFFEEFDQGWVSVRCNEEIARYQAMVEGGRKGATKRWAVDAKPIAPPCPPHMPGDLPPNGNQEPRTKNQEPIDPHTPLKGEARKRAVVIARPEGVTEQTWDSWLTLRRAKKAPVTSAAIARIAQQAEKAGWSLEAALEACCARGWTGFEAKWVTDQPFSKPLPVSATPSVDETRRMLDEARAPPVDLAKRKAALDMARLAVRAIQ